MHVKKRYQRFDGKLDSTKPKLSSTTLMIACKIQVSVLTNFSNFLLTIRTMLTLKNGSTWIMLEELCERLQAVGIYERFIDTNARCWWINEICRWKERMRNSDTSSWSAGRRISVSRGGTWIGGTEGDRTDMQRQIRIAKRLTQLGRLKRRVGQSFWNPVCQVHDNTFPRTLSLLPSCFYFYYNIIVMKKSFF